jgi:hypothetical protein
MAWDFRFQLNLELIHASEDPQRFTSVLSTLAPTYTARAGEQKVVRSGNVRVVQRSVWRARLHDEKYLHSTSDNLESVLENALELLTPYSGLFHEIKEGGYAYLQLVWFADSIHSVTVIPAKILATCGTAGLDLDIEFYGPNSSELDE